MKQEFAAHVASDRREGFQPKKSTNERFVKFVNLLETKRQTSVLTEPEVSWLNDIDILRENIASFNKGVFSVPADAAVSRGPQFGPSAEISEEEANKIIRDFEMQFENKVLKKLKVQGPSKATTKSLPDFSVPVPAEPKGQDLDGYLSSLQVAEPSIPFLDEDSHMDLSKIKHRKK